MSQLKYPDVAVRFEGKMSWHPIAAVRRVQLALEAAGADAAEVSAFAKEATSGDYRKLRATIMQWVTVSE